MTLEELVHALVFILCLAAGSVVLPVGLIVTSAPPSPADTAAGPAFIFEGGH
jgi:hypothetical protein